MGGFCRLASHKERNVDCLKITEQEYSQMTNQASPNSKCWRNALFAFLIGGLICVIGQILVNLYQQTGLSLQDARCAVSVTLVGLSAVLTALHVYDNIAKVAGAGTLVPITGFANSVAACALEFKAEGEVFGVGCKIFTIAGPVILYGIFSSWGLGLILWVLQMFGIRVG